MKINLKRIALRGVPLLWLASNGWCLDAPKTPALPAVPSALVGHWANTEQNDTVGVILNSDKSCVLYTSRLTAPKAERACKFEFYGDKTYFIYLKGADGACSADPDFEFRYYPDLGRVDLQVGGGSQFLLEKRPEKPLASPVTTKQ